MAKDRGESNDNNKVTIGKRTKFSLGVVITLLVLVVGATTAWMDLKYEIRALRDAVWGKVDDEFFMRDFAAFNGLNMTPHKRATDG